MSTEQTDTNPSVVITRQSQNGCVTSSIESLLVMHGFPFETEFLPDFRQYNIEPGNQKNNHMLGIIPVAVTKDLDISVHVKPKLSEYVLPESASPKAREIHLQLVDQIEFLSQQGRIFLTTGNLDKSAFLKRVTEEIRGVRGAIVALDWKKWATVGEPMRKAQEKFKNPFHAVHLYRVDGDNVKIMDPSLEESENPVDVTMDNLYFSLHDTQQIIFIGEKSKEITDR